MPATTYKAVGIDGIPRARAQGTRLGRPRAIVPFERVQGVASLPIGQAARTLRVSRSTLKRWRRQMSEPARGPCPSRRRSGEGVR
jgi:hypothetical protein